MKKHFITTLVVSMLVLSVGNSALADTGSSTPDVAALQAQVEMLLKQVKELQGAVQTQSSEINTLREELKISKRLKQGDQGDDVKLLQETLATDPDIYPEGKITGVFGPMTMRAVKRFQEKNDLDGVGTVGPKTQEVLNRFLKEGGAGESGKVPQGLLRMAGRMVMVPIRPLGDSKIKGYARIEDNIAGKAVVRIEMMNGEGMRLDASSTMPAHIHAGACPTPGAVSYPLAAVTAGRSETTLTVSTKELLAQLPLAINVHKSAAELSVYVACGDLKAPMMGMGSSTNMRGGMRGRDTERDGMRDMMPGMMGSGTPPMMRRGEGDDRRPPMMGSSTPQGMMLQGQVTQ